MRITIAGQVVEVGSIDELLTSGVVGKPITLFLFRHDSATLDLANLEALEAYCYGYGKVGNPGLKEKGQKSAQATAKLIEGFVDEWHTSPLERAQETVKIVAGTSEGIRVDWALRPANYYGVPKAAIAQYQADELAEDPEAENKLRQQYIATGAHVLDQQEVVQFIMETSVASDGIVGYMTHDERCRETMTFLLGTPVEEINDSRCKVDRGGYVEVNLTPAGKINIVKVDAEGKSEVLRAA